MPKHNRNRLQQLVFGSSRRGKRHRDPFEYVIYFFTIATPLFELPQAVTIYINHAAHDVSVWTWGFFIIDNLVWMVYGLRKKMKPLIITSILYLITECIVVYGIILYS